ncbi:hypothetical protein QN277_009544 [Acacia crassicarpa]|uniref:F-box domain-containing protein n=1 Tax=Acacia crassicarpa TaxID=499986 RepID=A0AAE1JJ33_9FABA|nr:hypothetical protein QN277_009544 [Acacia crassicarpa]
MPSSTTNVEMECDISPEVLSSIFKRLPVRTLARVQCVCKDWKNLLNYPSFIQEHLQYSARENPHLLFHGDTVLNPLELYVIDSEMQVLPVESVPLIEFPPLATVIGSINGLLCLKSNYEYLYILLWNPAISSFRLLTRQSNFWVKTGFGFCSVVNDYQVVCISHPRVTDPIYRVEVYSLSSCSWKEVEFGKLLDGVEVKSDGFSTNGAIFWFGYKKGNGRFLVSYYIATEEFALIPSPISAPELSDSLCYRLSVYENKLALLSHTTIGISEYSLIDLWVMEEVKDSISEERWSWTKKYRIKHPYLLLPGVVWRNMIVCNHIDILRERNTASEHNVIDEGLNIVLVNLTTDELKRFAFPKCGIGFQVFSYVESLVPVDKIHIEEF